MSEQSVRTSYDRWSEPYAERFADVAVAHPMDRALLTAFADLVLSDGGGRVADLGCAIARAIAPAGYLMVRQAGRSSASTIR